MARSWSTRGSTPARSRAKSCAARAGKSKAKALPTEELWVRLWPDSSALPGIAEHSQQIPAENLLDSRRAVPSIGEHHRERRQPPRRVQIRREQISLFRFPRRSDAGFTSLFRVLRERFLELVVDHGRRNRPV